MGERHLPFFVYGTLMHGLRNRRVIRPFLGRSCSEEGRRTAANIDEADAVENVVRATHPHARLYHYAPACYPGLVLPGQHPAPADMSERECGRFVVHGELITVCSSMYDGALAALDELEGIGQGGRYSRVCETVWAWDASVSDVTGNADANDQPWRQGRPVEAWVYVWRATEPDCRIAVETAPLAAIDAGPVASKDTRADGLTVAATAHLVPSPADWREHVKAMKHVGPNPYTHTHMHPEE